VYFGSSETFTMNAGTISGNTAATNNGGGVYVEAGNFNMNGNAVIRDNEAKVNGGGVYFDSSENFTMNRGTNSGNKAATGYGGGVYIAGGGFTKTGGIIYGKDELDDRKNTAAADRYGHAVSANISSWRDTTAGEGDNTGSGSGFWESPQ
jgi:hypothetical protein